MIALRSLRLPGIVTHRTSFATAALTLACVTGDLRAQDRDDFAVTASLPTAIGVQWHLTERLAMRPDFSGSHVIGNVAGAATTMTPGVSLLFFLKERSQTRAYFAPRLQQQTLRREGAPTFVTWGAAASFGVLHRPRDERIALFAEAGALASWYDADFGGGNFYSSTSWTIRSSIGVAWYP